MIGQAGRLYKNAFSGLSRNNWLLGLVMLVNRSGSMVVPFLTVYLTRVLGFSVTDAGYVLMCYGAGSLAGGYLGGRLSDRLGFYPVMLTTLSLNGIFFILLAFLKSFSSFCLFTFIVSLAGESFRPANSSAIAFYSEAHNRTRSYSVHRLAVNLGWGIGLALGGWLASVNYLLIFYVDGITCLLAAACLYFFLPKPEQKAGKEFRAQNAKEEKHSAYRDKTYLFFILMVILFATCFFQMSTTLTLFYKEVVKLDEKYFGMILSINGLLIALVEMILVYLLEGRRNGFVYISWGAVLLGFSFLMLNLLPAVFFTMVFSMVVLTFAEMLAMPFMNSFWIARSRDHNRGEYAGLYTMAWSVAQMLAPVAGTQVIRHFGYQSLWYAIATVSLVVLAGAQFLMRRVSGV